MYGDIWKKGDYLNWMYENLTAIKSVMSETAAIYAHLDWHVGHYVKVMMDEIFGEHNFRNEIVWYYYNKLQGNVNRFASNHDVVFWYTMSDEYVFSQQKDEREEPTTQIKRVWDKRKGRLVNAKDEMGKVIYQEATHRTVDDVWRLSMLQPADKTEKLDYGGTQKPESVLNRIIEASSKEGMVVADFFGGSGTTARAAHKLGRSFIHVDVGVNSIQTTRDELMSFGAQFEIVDVKDGVSLFRNPVQTMDKLKTLITGLKNENGLDKFWEGAINDSKLGMVPVYLPNLLDHTTKVLDIPLTNRLLRQALPDLPEGVKQAIVYFVDIEDRKAVLDFIKENNPTDIKVELRDLKEVLDEVVLNDEVDYKSSKTKRGYEVKIKRFVSDRLQQKIDEYNQKKELGEKAPLFVQDANDEADDEGESGKRTKFKPIEISDDGLELIELVSLDCTKAKGTWHSDTEIKIDKKGFVIRDGKKTKDFWDAKISSPKKPLRLKVRNIAGDESILPL
jgi:adenine-specific DNA-methyltransferase